MKLQKTKAKKQPEKDRQIPLRGATIRLTANVPKASMEAGRK